MSEAEPGTARKVLRVELKASEISFCFRLARVMCESIHCECEWRWWLSPLSHYHHSLFWYTFKIVTEA